MKGVPISDELTTVGNDTKVHKTTLDEIQLFDVDGNVHGIMAFAIEEVCGTMSEAQVDHLFSVTEI